MVKAGSFIPAFLCRSMWLHASSVRGPAHRHRREGWIDFAAAHKIKRRLERLVVPGIERDVGLRAGFLLTIGFEVTKQGRFTARAGPGFELLRHLLQHLD